jgi:hypothetical protein
VVLLDSTAAEDEDEDGEEAEAEAGPDVLPADMEDKEDEEEV